MSNRRLMISMISRVIPSRSASGSCAAYSNWLSSSRAVREDGQFANTPPKPCFASKIEIERPRVSREVWTMEKDAAGTSQPPERPVFRIGEAVIDPLSVGIEVFAFRQRQSASRLGVDILGMHWFLRSQPIPSWLLTEIAPPSQPATKGMT